MFEAQFFCVQTDARPRRTAIKCVAKNREPALGRMNTNLMRASRERLGSDSLEARLQAVRWPRCRRDSKPRLRQFTARVTGVTITCARDARLHDELAACHRPISQQQ